MANEVASDGLSTTDDGARGPIDPSTLPPSYPYEELMTRTLERKRRRRRQRTVDRVRWGLLLMGGMIVATTFSTLPIANDIATSTLDLLSIRSDDAAPPEFTSTTVAPEVESEQASTVWDTSVWVDPLMVGVAPPQAVKGLLGFRGSPTRSWYGAGPIPDDPEIMWRYPETGGLCRQSTVGAQTRTWCGTGWTGQATLFERDGELWTVFGALDGAVHFLDAMTGEPVLPKFETDDIIKGSITVDPDGYPLVYTGSRDDKFRIVSFDGDEPVELWSLHADDSGPTLWNNDWDGNALVLDDFLFIGGENSRIHIVKLNRGFDADGDVVVDPAVVFTAPGWDSELVATVGENVSIENSVAISGDTLWFANSGGLVQGWDIAQLADGVDPERVFRFWVGDDVDATLVIDEEGMLYVAAEFERGNARSRELGQLIKLDPTKDGDDAVVWSVQENQGINTGIWGTPALHRDVVIFGSEGGRLRAVDRMTGDDVWEIGLGFHLWQSPVVVDDVLLMGNCSGVLRAFDVSDTRITPPERWALPLDDGCIESTPAVFGGRIVVGTRRGGVYGVG